MVYQAEMYLSLLIIINTNIQHFWTYSIRSRGPCSCNNVALPFFHPNFFWPTWICGLHDHNTYKILVSFPSKYDVDNTAAFIFIFLILICNFSLISSVILSIPKNDIWVYNILHKFKVQPHLQIINKKLFVQYLTLGCQMLASTHSIYKWSKDYIACKRSTRSNSEESIGKIAENICNVKHLFLYL